MVTPPLAVMVEPTPVLWFMPIRKLLPAVAVKVPVVDTLPAMVMSPVPCSKRLLPDVELRFPPKNRCPPYTDTDPAMDTGPTIAMLPLVDNRVLEPKLTESEVMLMLALDVATVELRLLTVTADGVLPK